MHRTLFNDTSLADGAHTLSVVIHPTGNASNMFFDYITYTPSANLSLKEGYYFYDDTHPSLMYTGTWYASDPSAPGAYENFYNTTHVASAGSTMTFEFNGKLAA